MSRPDMWRWHMHAAHAWPLPTAYGHTEEAAALAHLELVESGDHVHWPDELDEVPPGHP